MWPEGGARQVPNRLHQVRSYSMAYLTRNIHRSTPLNTFIYILLYCYIPGFSNPNYISGQTGTFFFFLFPQGEWLAFTAVADEPDFWEVGASVASGLNGTTVEFRILVNATNCSTPATDGFDGLGGEGVDLLNGPLLGGFTGSWEAFEMISKEEVYVPQGTHRFLFCSDAGVFNLNFLRVWTPAPTLAPTMAPTVAPTPAPTAPSDDSGVDTKWIYIGVSCSRSARRVCACV